MPNPTTVTAGPWEVEKPPLDFSKSFMVTVGFVGDCRFGPITDMPGGNYRNWAGAYEEDDAKLICSAVNACFSVSKDHPERVAELIPEAFEKLRQVVAIVEIAKKEQWRNAAGELAYREPWASLAMEISKFLAKLNTEDSQ